MKFEYLPQKIDLQHSFRYINGVQIYKGKNEIDYDLAQSLTEDETFKNLITQGAIVLTQEKTEVLNGQPMVETTEVNTPVVPSPMESKPVVSTIELKISELTEAEAINQINQSLTIDQLNSYKADETATKQRQRVFYAIAKKITELDTKK